MRTHTPNSAGTKPQEFMHRITQGCTCSSCQEYEIHRLREDNKKLYDEILSLKLRLNVQIAECERLASDATMVTDSLVQISRRFAEELIRRRNAESALEVARMNAVEIVPDAVPVHADH